VVRRRLQTEKFILVQLGGRGWMVDSSLKQLGNASRVVVEDSGSTMVQVWNSVLAREGVRGLFKVRCPVPCARVCVRAGPWR
jgi:hypothetical protein